jgi:hypothetical protein
MKKLIVIGLALLITVPVLAAGIKATLVNPSGDKVVVEAGSVEAQKYFGKGYTLMGAENNLGAFAGPRIMQDIEIRGTLKNKVYTKAIAATSVYATTTLKLADSGTTYLISASGTTITLPAIAGSAGAIFRFIINGAVDTGNVMITSAEGDNIEGSVIVAGAVVDCNAADVLTFVADGENIGDFVEVMSTGTYWVPLQSGVLTGSKLTCSG